MKECSVCHTVGDLANRSSMCKPCHRAYVRNHYQENKQYYIDKAAKRNAQAAQKIAEYKESNPCMDCKQYFPAVCMDFDHIDENKLFNVSSKRSSGFSEAVLEEVRKCELVCANCHRIRTAQRHAVIA